MRGIFWMRGVLYSRNSSDDLQSLFDLTGTAKRERESWESPQLKALIFNSSVLPLQLVTERFAVERDLALEGRKGGREGRKKGERKGQESQSEEEGYLDESIVTSKGDLRHFSDCHFFYSTSAHAYSMWLYCNLFQGQTQNLCLLLHAFTVWFTHARSASKHLLDVLLYMWNLHLPTTSQGRVLPISTS